MLCLDSFDLVGCVFDDGYKILDLALSLGGIIVTAVFSYLIYKIEKNRDGNGFHVTLPDASGTVTLRNESLKTEALVVELGLLDGDVYMNKPATHTKIREAIKNGDLVDLLRQRIENAVLFETILPKQFLHPKESVNFHIYDLNRERAWVGYFLVRIKLNKDRYFLYRFVGDQAIKAGLTNVRGIHPTGWHQVIQFDR